MLKVVILAMCFKGDITFVISELKVKASLKKFTADQFVDMVLITVNAVCGKRKSVKTIIIGDTTNLTVDINMFRKKYKSEDLKDKN